MSELLDGRCYMTWHSNSDVPLDTYGKVYFNHGDGYSSEIFLSSFGQFVNLESFCSALVKHTIEQERRQLAGDLRVMLLGLE